MSNSASARGGSKIIRHVLQVLILLVITVIGVRVFLVDSFIVVGDSMAPSVTGGDYVFVNKTAYVGKNPVPGDIIVGSFRNSNIKIIKRVIAVSPSWITVTPLDVTIKDGREGTSTVVNDQQYIELPGYATNGATTTYRLDPQEYFVMGDNRAVSEDSRVFGPVDIWNIEGRVFFRFRISNHTFTKF
jgi:signal peptidase I